jgi:hypothetical protein
MTIPSLKVALDLIKKAKEEDYKSPLGTYYVSNCYSSLEDLNDDRAICELRPLTGEEWDFGNINPEHSFRYLVALKEQPIKEKK